MRKRRPVTMAVRPDPSIPWVTSSAVELAENPDAPFLEKGHIVSRIDQITTRTEIGALFCF